MNKAVGILIRHRNEFLLCKRSPEMGVLSGHWAVPAGMVEEGERLSHAAIRELYEETRISLVESQIRKVTTHKNFSLFYHCSPFRYYPILDIEHVGYAYFSVEHLPFPMDIQLRDEIKYLTTALKPDII